MQSHFFQSKSWKNFQEKLGRTVITGDGKGWFYTAVVEKDRFGRFAYAAYGPSAVNEQALKEAIDDMKTKARAAGAYMLLVEPYLPITSDIAAKILHKRVAQRQPPITQWIDLTRTEDEIIAGMNATRRNEHRNHQKKGLSIEQSSDPKDIDVLVRLLQDNAKEKRFFVRDRRYFEVMRETLIKNGDASLYIGRFEGKPIIAALAYDDKDTRYYAYMGRDYNYAHVQANGPLVSRMILDGKARGQKTFDLFGVSLDDDPSNPRYGYTKFKRTMGGTTVHFAGTWDVVLSWPQYHAMSLAQSIKKRIHKRK